METVGYLDERAKDGLSPTRLEGMETAWISVWVVELVKSPTRLEGMETVKNNRIGFEGNTSPTRLEGMETQSAHRDPERDPQVSDPP